MSSDGFIAGLIADKRGGYIIDGEGEGEGFPREKLGSGERGGAETDDNEEGCDRCVTWSMELEGREERKRDVGVVMGDERGRGV